MKTFLNTIIFLVSASLSPNIIAYPEIPFCPAGGAPGWMNYMDYKRDQNIWQHNHYASRYPPLNYTTTIVSLTIIETRYMHRVTIQVTQHPQDNKIATLIVRWFYITDIL